MDGQDRIELFRTLEVSEVEARAQHSDLFSDISAEISLTLYGID